MKQVSQNYRTGKIRVEHAAQPSLRPGNVLVHTAFSLISAGTEGMKVREGKMSLLEKAKARPDQVKKVLKSAREQGLTATYQKVINRLDSLTPLGYSLSGHVTDVGRGVTDLKAGQPVACAGAGYANHAEINSIPNNLAVPIPPGVTMEHAAFATVGAIALHAFRRANMQVGEVGCVIGLGLIGQLLNQIMRAAGIRVVGVEMSPERCTLAQESGADIATKPDDPRLPHAVQALTNGHGVDCVFIAAGGGGNGPVELAAEIARDRATVIDVGKTSLDLPWNAYYEKELDVKFSRSYGPGRYDPNYEEKGIDYPIGYVRWTERRNMAAFLDLVAQRKIDLSKILTAVHPFDTAETVYQDLADAKLQGLGVLFAYTPQAHNQPPPHNATTATPVNQPSPKPVNGNVRLAVIGAGNYASSMLLPHLKRMQHAQLVDVATATGLSAINAQQKFGFERAGTNYQSVLAADDTHAAIIATRHSAHAHMVTQAIRAGKAVFVEKPLAVDLAGVESVRNAITETQNDRLYVGFNRRFAPLIQRIADAFHPVKGPLVMNYRVHAGRLADGSWYLDPQEGSRFVGEAGHFIDVMSYLSAARPVRVTAASPGLANQTPDDRANLTATIEYDDGSIANLLYLTQGGLKVPKESLEVFGGGVTAHLDDFSSLSIYQSTQRERIKARAKDKGQAHQLTAFINAVHNQTPMPISVDSLIDTTLATLAAERSAATRRPVEISDFWSTPDDRSHPHPDHPPTGATSPKVEISADPSRIKPAGTLE